jgi:hypothetical protein
MYLSLVNLFPVLLTFSAALGVFMHDSQLDRATVTAFNAPVITAVDTSVNVPKFSDFHTHTESSSEQLQVNQPTAQPRSEDKKYIVSKKLVSNSAGSDYSWPSI